MTAKNIHDALNRVMAQVGYVQKQAGRNLNYTYAGEAALIAAIRPHLVENGVVVYPHKINREITSYQTARGATMQRSIVDVVFRFYHAASDTWTEVAVCGEGADVGDKSINKAMTGALKYALRQTLLIETGDDPDQFASEPAAPQPEPVRQRTSPAQPAPQTNGVRPYPPDQLPTVIKTIAKRKAIQEMPPPTDRAFQRGAAMIAKALPEDAGEDGRHIFQEKLFGVASLTFLNPALLWAALYWLDGGNINGNNWSPDDTAAAEARAFWNTLELLPQENTP